MRTAEELIEARIKDLIPPKGYFDKVLKGTTDVLESIGDLERTLTRLNEPGLRTEVKMVKNAAIIMAKVESSIAKLSRF